ncbi:MAG TPA: carbon-nitrogen hydrolase family protein [Solirubrobacterales bacterium]|jgi:predicted amidohydrolase|nr:carbon-nitrogen hydrolase family protein [Solirubrobacterales bacterium]
MTSVFDNGNQSRSIKATAIQLNATDDVVANMAAADRLTREAAATGADLVLLPEKFNVLGKSSDYFAAAEPLDGPLVTWARSLAAEFKMDFVAGSFVERVEGRDKLANTSVHIGPDGEIKAVYRKIHMFDVEVDGVPYRESDHEDPGTEIVTTRLAAGATLGLTVCYDLRFPELYRILTVRGARILTVPAAFTYTTGAAHWEILLRARAIENQAFVVAADQFGYHDGDRRCYGNSMIVDPWGTILNRAGDDSEAVISADLDLDAQRQIRDKLPSLANRMPESYSW